MVVYLFLLLTLTLAYKNAQPPPASERIRLTPFESITRDLSRGGRGFWVNIVGNVVVFTPLGAAFVLLGSRPRLWHAALAGLALSAAIEAAQSRSGSRFSDVDDVILNTLGAALGFVAIDAARHLLRPAREPG
nr:VanZ family protein [Paludisphaera mucosa]